MKMRQPWFTVVLAAALFATAPATGAVARTESVAVRIHRGQVLLRQGKTDLALRTWAAALRRPQAQARDYATVSDRCRAAGLDREAVGFLESAATKLGDPTLFAWDRSQLHARLGDHLAALQAYAQVLRSQPQRYALIEARELELVRDSQTAPAVLAALDQVLASDTATSPPPQLRLLAANCYLETQQPEKGLECLLQARDPSTVSQFLYSYASRCEARRYRIIAARAYAEFAARQPQSPYHCHALVRQAQLLREAEAPQRALQAYTRLISRRSSCRQQAEALMGFARLQLEMADGDPQAARKALQRLLARNQQDQWTRDAHAVLAEAYLRAGDLAAAQAQVDELRTLAPDDPYVWGFPQAELHFLQGQLPEAENELHTLLENGTDHLLANDALALLLTCETLRETPASASHYAAARLAERQRHPADARPHWHWLDEQAPPEVHAQALLERARWRLAEGGREQARHLLERLLTEHPDSVFGIDAQRELATLLEEDGRQQLALRTLESALLKTPNSAQAPVIRLRIQQLRSRLAPADSASQSQP